LYKTHIKKCILFCGELNIGKICTQRRKKTSGNKTNKKRTF